MRAEGFSNSWRRGFGLLAILTLLTGCALSPAERANRAEVLKHRVRAFTDSTIQKDWDGLFKMTDGSFADSASFEAYMTQPWDAAAVLTGANITSLAWVNDSTTKVKINWIFQEGAILSYSSETFVWVWKDSTWKLMGRVLR